MPPFRGAFLPTNSENLKPLDLDQEERNSAAYPTLHPAHSPWGRALLMPESWVCECLAAPARRKEIETAPQLSKKVKLC